MLYDHDIDEQFSNAIRQLKAEVIEQRKDPDEVLRRWAGVKSRRTIQGWENGEFTPRDWRCIWRLAQNAKTAGFPSFLEAMAGDEPDLPEVSLRSLSGPGSLAREHVRSTIAWGMILRGDTMGTHSEIIDGANELRSISDTVFEYAQREIERSAA